MIKKNNYFTCFIFFMPIYLTSLWGKKNILANLTNSQEPEMEPEPGVLAPWSRSRSRLRKKTRSRSRSRLGKRIRSRSRLRKKSQEPESKKKNFLAPQP